MRKLTIIIILALFSGCISPQADQNFWNDFNENYQRQLDRNWNWAQQENQRLQLQRINRNLQSIDRKLGY